MDIVIQSLLRDVGQLSSSIHVRYSAKPTDRLPSTDHTRTDQNKECEVFHESSTTNTTNKPSTYVVIQREYAYLEPAVRTTFQDAQDVRVFTDRRFMERRKSNKGDAPSDRRTLHDRRGSSPMLDILIDINGRSS
jgi:hypothetical protein